jgi:hypothetical protein
LAHLSDQSIVLVLVVEGVLSAWQGALPVRRSLWFYVHFFFGSAKSDPRAPQTPAGPIDFA